MEEASFSVHILVSRPQHARAGRGTTLNTDLAAPEAFVLAYMSVHCVDPSGSMNSVGSVISCVNRNKVGPAGCACECDEY